MRYSLLDPFRGLAALWVFTYHYEFSQTFIDWFPFLHAFFKKGDLGVPMFFVISGYCLTASAKATMRNRESPGNFLYRRALRIFPPYWFSIGVVVAVPFIMELVSALKTGRFAPPSATQYASNGFLAFDWMDWLRFVTLTQAFSPVPDVAGLHMKFAALNAVYWSLAIEFQFYLIVLIALCFRARFYLTLLLVTALSIPFALVPATYTVGVFLPYWPMFGLGIALYWSCERQRTPDKLLGARAATAVAALLVCLMIAGLAAGIDPAHFGLAALFAVALWFGRGVDSRFAQLAQSPRPVVRIGVSMLLVLGAMSYTLYLLHNRLQFLVIQFGRQVLPVNSLVFDVFVLVATCVLCYPFYRYCEAPFCRARKGEKQQRTEEREPTPRLAERVSVEGAMGCSGISPLEGGVARERSVAR